MRTDIYWIDAERPGRLAVLARPRGGDWLEDEARAWQVAGIDVVVSLLTPEEEHELGLGQEAAAVGSTGMEYVALPVPDRGVPESHAVVRTVAGRLAEHLASGKNVGMHCRIGVGRSALLAVGVLVMSGMEVEEALRRVSAARGCPVPETAQQRDWITRFARDLAMAG